MAPLLWNFECIFCTYIRRNQERRESKLWSCDSGAALIAHDVTAPMTMHLRKNWQSVHNITFVNKANFVKLYNNFVLKWLIFALYSGCCTRTDIVREIREHLEDTLRICDVSAMGLYDDDYDNSAHSPSWLFSDRLHQVLRLLVLPTKLSLFIFTTIVILLS
jgi:hypothetical protein